MYVYLYVYTYIKYTYIFFGKKFYFGIEIGNVTDLIHLVLEEISMEVEFNFLRQRLFLWRSFVF